MQQTVLRTVTASINQNLATTYYMNILIWQLLHTYVYECNYFFICGVTSDLISSHGQAQIIH